MKTCVSFVRTALALLLALSCVLALAACGARAPADEQSSAATKNAEGAAAQEKSSPSPHTAGTMQWISALPDFFTGANTGDAFYELACTSNAWQNENVLILKTDYATGKETCLCQKAGCAHTDEACNAYVKNARGLKLAVTESAVYLLYESQPAFIDAHELGRTEEDYAKQREMLPTQEEKIAFDKAREANRAQSEENIKKCSYVDEISLDGTQKRRLAEFPRNMNVSFACTDGAFLYGSYYELSENGGEEKREGVWADLHTGEFGTYALNNASIVGIFQNKIIATKVASEQDLSQLVTTNPEAYMAAYQNAAYEYRAIDPFTSESELVAKLPVTTNGWGVSFTTNDRLYYSRSKEEMAHFSVEFIDFATGETTVLLEDVEKMAVGTSGTGAIGPSRNGMLLYAAAVQYGEMPYDALLNLETGEIIESALPAASPSDNITMPVPVAQTKDGRWLVVTGRFSKAQLNRARYALISPEDFLAGNAKYTEVQAYVQSA